MRQYTNKEQTQHLIELGFPRPKIIANTEVEELSSGATHMFSRYDYSIGELLSFLDGYMTEPTDELLIWKDILFWYVRFASDMKCSCYDPELINALYKYIVELKEEVI